MTTANPGGALEAAISRRRRHAAMVALAWLCASLFSVEAAAGESRSDSWRVGVRACQACRGPIDCGRSRTGQSRRPPGTFTFTPRPWCRRTQRRPAVGCAPVSRARARRLGTHAARNGRRRGETARRHRICARSGGRSCPPKRMRSTCRRAGSASARASARASLRRGHAVADADAAGANADGQVTLPASASPMRRALRGAG